MPNGIPFYIPHIATIVTNTLQDFGGADIINMRVVDSGQYGVGGSLSDEVTTEVEVLRAAQLPVLTVSNVLQGYEDLGVNLPITITPTSSQERVWVDIYVPEDVSLSAGMVCV